MSVPPIVKFLAFLAVLAAGYELAPKVLLTIIGVVALYLVLTNSNKIGEITSNVPAGFNRVIAPSARTAPRGPGGNLPS